MSGGVHSKVAPSMLRCSVCGRPQWIWRRQARRRGRGHVKHLWCPTCEERTAHIEELEDEA